MIRADRVGALSFLAGEGLPAPLASDGRDALNPDNRAMAKPIPRLSPAAIARVVEIAWDDRAPFNAVLMSHGLGEGQVVALMKRELTPNAYKLWAQRSGTQRGAPGKPRR